MAQLLASLFSVSFNTVLIIFAVCTLGSLVLRTQLDDPFISFAFQPVLAFLSVLVFSGLNAAGFIEPIITTDWIKGILVSSTMGIGIGIGLILLCVAKFEARSDTIETTLTKRNAQTRKQTAIGEKRVARTGQR
jgi:hypothetical protein